MNTKPISIGSIPAVIWGEPSDKLILAVHGNQSSMTDVPIALLAEEADSLGFQVLSFDLPEHGERKDAPERCNPQNCSRDLAAVLAYAKANDEEISLFACSMGAYFSLLTFADQAIERAWFLSPVTDMERIIHNIMGYCNVSEEEFERQKIVQTPFETLYWDYYQYVKEHPVTRWSHPTHILRGETDTLSESDIVAGFANRFGCELVEQKGGEHWFHTPEQLDYFRGWLKGRLG